MDLNLTNVINVSVSEAQTGVGQYNTSNIALFTNEPFANTFGNLGYNIYLSPQQVGVDFGTGSETYAMANAIFSQQPNILTGGGYLVVIPMVEAIQHLSLSAVPASGSFTLVYPQGTTAAINWNDPLLTIQAKVQAVFPDAIVIGSLASESLHIDFQGVYGPVALPTFGGPGLEDSGSASITITPTTSQVGENIAAAISRTQNLVQYFGIIGTQIFSQADTLAAAAVVLALNKIMFFVSQTAADLNPGGLLDLLRSGDFNNSRGLYYGAQPIVAIQNISLSSLPASGTFVLNYNGNPSAAINWNDTVSQIQTKLQAVSGLASATVAGSLASQNLVVTFTGVNGPAPLLTVTSNSVENSGSSPVAFIITNLTVGLSIQAAILEALVMMASYAGRGLSTDFTGSNTTSTMHLKDLLGVQPDPSMTQTLLNLAQSAGADCYVSLQGVAKVFCSGANKFFDQVYNLQWFVGDLQVTGFNYLAQSSTKIPQTENAMNGLKGAYRQVCEQAVTNQYSAPGTWNSATTFGNQNDFLLNIAQRGYYIFSQPISQQAQTNREARQAPLVQIALKEAGAIHSSNVIVNINA